ncbi:hypothetical protein [Bifidobacterium parmae]|uniref:ABC transporter ATP-binding protein n=1 Tax=Bifidobacterium parmae TaxID=361854 RepID=A0A2N5J4R5_9BIFI|nr:hypothetical protein [Bifidobacterium parmae]PLS29169.1 ABC transporter ATP-binding protein [Bifidobacterium parmae]
MTPESIVGALVLIIVPILILAIGFLGLCFLFGLGIGHTIRRHMPVRFRNMPERTEPAEPTANAVANVAARCGIQPDPLGWMGWATVTRDMGGMPDPIMPSIKASAYVDTGWHMRGTPGVGLEGSGFDRNAVSAGEYGERMLAGAIRAVQPPVLSWWSLYGMDQYGDPTDKDIDCILMGLKPDGRPVAWFVDAKRYKGGSDTSYVNVDAGNLVRISRSQRAFIIGSDGEPWMRMSDNMAVQQRNWARLLRRFNVESYWVVCPIPGPNGAPDLRSAVWPGGVTCMDMQSLLAHVNATCVPGGEAMLPPLLVAEIDRRLKG